MHTTEQTVMKEKIELVNDFHGTYANVVVPWTGSSVHFISRSTFNRVRRALCGMLDCQCGQTNGRVTMHADYEGQRGKFAIIRHS